MLQQTSCKRELDVIFGRETYEHIHGGGTEQKARREDRLQQSHCALVCAPPAGEGMLHEAPGSASEDSMDREQHTAPQTMTLCEECEHQPATVHCSSCRADLCANCWPKVHSLNITRKHT